MTDTITKGAFPAELLKTMTKNYNAVLLSVFLQAKQAGRTKDDDEPEKVDEATVEAIAGQEIEKKLNSTGGAMLMEIAAWLAIKFGTTGSGFKMTEIPKGLPANLKAEEKADVLAARDDAWAKSKATWEAKRKAEVALFIAPVEAYLLKFGKELRNPMGQIIGIGDRVTFEKGHYRLIY
jgi:hypothetical protein